MNKNKNMEKLENVIGRLMNNNKNKEIIKENIEKT